MAIASEQRPAGRWDAGQPNREPAACGDGRLFPTSLSTSINRPKSSGEPAHDAARTASTKPAKLAVKQNKLRDRDG
jgi:hypothetical protein